MHVFMYTVDLPAHPANDRIVTMVEEKNSCIILWTAKELSKYYSGEFEWKKLGLFGVCALQYINRERVRLIVKSIDRDTADKTVSSYAWYLDRKKFHKRKYAPRKSGTLVKTTYPTANNLIVA